MVFSRSCVSVSCSQGYVMISWSPAADMPANSDRFLGCWGHPVVVCQPHLCMCCFSCSWCPRALHLILRLHPGAAHPVSSPRSRWLPLSCTILPQRTLKTWYCRWVSRFTVIYLGLWLCELINQGPASRRAEVQSPNYVKYSYMPYSKTEES